jgi:hypothetical protein
LVRSPALKSIAPRDASQQQPGRFDPGHCLDCARETDLLDHYWQVQLEEQAFK